MNGIAAADREGAPRKIYRIIVDPNQASDLKRAKALGVRSVPAVAIDGKLAECCTGRGINVQVLRAAGLGTPL
jgi:hypothetical protein